jgi:hypothetical protein
MRVLLRVIKIIDVPSIKIIDGMVDFTGRIDGQTKYRWPLLSLFQVRLSVTSFESTALLCPTHDIGRWLLGAVTAP